MNKAPTIDEYIKRMARGLTAKDWKRLMPLLKNLPDRASGADASRHPRLAPQAVALGDILAINGGSRSFQKNHAELAVGALYLLKGFDVIPDSVKVIGFDDDAFLLDRIFTRNRPALETLLEDKLPAVTISRLFS